MSVQVVGNGGVILDVDEARNLQVFESIPGYPAAGGFYTVTGHTAAVIAASSFCCSARSLAAAFAMP